MDVDAKLNSTSFKCGYAVIIGEPNVGKSTLMNSMLDMKLSIVTAKPQTTRHRILGILTEDNCQIIFLDTPGLIEPKYKLHEYMLKAVEKAIAEADVILFTIEAKSSISRNETLLSSIIKTRTPVLLVINKVDRIEKQNLLPIIQNYKDRHSFAEIIPVSALHCDGIDLLKSGIKKYIPYSPPLYPPDMITENPERFFVAELIRENIFEMFRDEIPYSTTVIINEFKERQNSKDFISATIYVERISQKGIIIGKKGSALKNLGQLARQDIEKFLERGVYLELHVSVKENWRYKEIALRHLGYQ